MAVLVFIIFILIGLWIICFIGGKILKKEQTPIPEKIGARSYIDENTGTIFLRSDDYHTRGGREWIVSNSTLTVKLNNSSNSQIIPLSKIHTLNLDQKEHFSSLSFEILAERQYMVGDLPMSRIEPTAQTPIFLKNKDIEFAKAICNRVAEFSAT